MEKYSKPVVTAIYLFKQEDVIRVSSSDDEWKGPFVKN